jgi:hypothetical protein
MSDTFRLALPSAYCSEILNSGTIEDYVVGGDLDGATSDIPSIFTSDAVGWKAGFHFGKELRK